MNISYRWLQTLVPDRRTTRRRVADRLAMYGAPVDEIVPIGEAAARCRDRARRRAAQRHPNADRLSLCQVDAGSGELLASCAARRTCARTCSIRSRRSARRCPAASSIESARSAARRARACCAVRASSSWAATTTASSSCTATSRPAQSFIEAVGLDDYRLVVDVTPNRPRPAFAHRHCARAGARRRSRHRAAAIPRRDPRRSCRVARRRARGRHRRRRASRIEDAGAVPALHGRGHPRRARRPVAGVAGGAAACDRCSGRSTTWSTRRTTCCTSSGSRCTRSTSTKLRRHAIIVRRARAGEAGHARWRGTQRSHRTCWSSPTRQAQPPIAGVMGGQRQRSQRRARRRAASSARTSSRSRCGKTRARSACPRMRASASSAASTRTAWSVATQRVVDADRLAIAGGTIDAQAADVLAQPLPGMRSRCGRPALRQVLGR